jgi:glutaredoxin
MAVVGVKRFVKMFSRRRCGLCDEARAVIFDEQRRDPDGFVFEEAFIDGDESLESEYGLRVPVILIDGVESFEYHVDPARLRALL